MKHGKFYTALLLTLCGSLLMGCSCVSRVVDEGESMMNDLESSLLGHENSQGNLKNDSGLNDSRLENSRHTGTESMPGLVHDDGDTSGATGTTNGINGDGSDPVDENSDHINNTTGTENSTPATNEQQLSEEEAIEIALHEAGASRDSVSQLTCHLDYDDTTGEPYYEIDFMVDNKDYDFEISALDGSIIDLDREG